MDYLQVHARFFQGCPVSSKSRFHVRLTTIALCVAAASLTAACGGGGGGEASANEADAARRATSAPIPSDAAFSCDFSNGWQNCGFMEQAKEPGRATIVNIAGVNAVRLHTEPGDNNVNGSNTWERNDLTTSQATTDGYEGKEHWWEHSVWFPDDYVQPPQSVPGGIWNNGLVFDFHDTANRGGQANFQIAIYPATAPVSEPGWPTGMHLQLHAGNPAAPVKVDVAVQKGAITKNRWYTFKYHVRWADDSTGFFQAWVNDVLYMDHKGPTLYTGQGVYLKLANYHSAFGQPSSVIHARVIRSNTPL